MKKRLIDVLTDEQQEILKESVGASQARNILEKEIDTLTIAEFKNAATTLRKAVAAYPSDAQLLIDFINDSIGW